MTHLALRAWFALAALAVVMGLLLFIPAGTVSYWQAWVDLGIFFAASQLTAAFLIRRDPAGTPLALGSYWGLVPLAATIPFLIWRLFDEETLLAEKPPATSTIRTR